MTEANEQAQREREAARHIRSGAESRASGAERLRALEADRDALAARLAALEARSRPDPVTMAEQLAAVQQRSTLDSGLDLTQQFNRNSTGYGPAVGQDATAQVGPGSWERPDPHKRSVMWETRSGPLYDNGGDHLYRNQTSAINHAVQPLGSEPT